MGLRKGSVSQGGRERGPVWRGIRYAEGNRIPRDSLNKWSLGMTVVQRFLGGIG